MPDYDNAAKNQHFVPQTYMRAWSYNDTDSVWVYDKKNRLAKDNAEPEGIDSWKLESRDVEHINCINYFYDFKAEDMWIPEEGIKHIFGFVFDEGYNVSIEKVDAKQNKVVQMLSTPEDLYKNYFDFEDWKVNKPDGTAAERKIRNQIRKRIEQSRYSLTEVEWSRQYENEWSKFIRGLEEKARTIKQSVQKYKGKGDIAHNQSLVKGEDLDRLLSYLIMFDWRTDKGNQYVSSILDSIASMTSEIMLMDIGDEKERPHYDDKTVIEQIKHEYMRKQCYLFLTGQHSMMDTVMEQYKEHLTIAFYLTDKKNPFITSDNPSEMITREDGFKEHIFVATPTLMISTYKKNGEGSFVINSLYPSSVVEYNKYIAQVSDIILVPNEEFNVRGLFV